MSAEKQLGPGDDLEMMRSPDRWPCWPVLPLKRYDGKDRCGFPSTGLIAELDGVPRFTVFDGNLFQRPLCFDDPKTVRYDYDSFEAMLADGWVVD